jgi:YD repeat-containing protein
MNNVTLLQSSWYLVSCRFLSLAACTALMLPVAGAQNNGASDVTTTPVAGVPHDYLGDLAESVNPANGAVSIRIKAPTPHERGVNWPTYPLMWDSTNYWVMTPAWTVENDSPPHDTLAGVNLDWDPPTFGTASAQSLTLPSGNNTTTTYYCDIATGYSFTDPDGGNHAMGLKYAPLSNPTPGVQNYNCSYFNLGTQYTTGGDELFKARMDTSAWPPTTTVFDTHGNTLLVTNTPYGDSNNIHPTYEDTNGNYQNTTGRSWSSSSSTSGNTTTITETIPGSSSAWTIAYTTPSTNPSLFSVPVSYVGPTDGAAFCNVSSAAGGGQQPNGPTASLLSNITVTLPNALKYTLDFSNNSYGLVGQITYPTGATVTYTWSIIPDMEGGVYTDKWGSGETAICALRYGWYAVTKRVVAYNGQNVEEQDFTYSTIWPAVGDSLSSYMWTSKSTTVTTTDLIQKKGFNTVYTYTPMAPPATTDYSGYWGNPSPIPVESEIKYYDTNGSQLKTVTKTWASVSLLSGECDTLPNGNTSGTFYQYEPGGVSGVNSGASMTNLPGDVQEYDYGTVSGPGSGCVSPATSSSIPVPAGNNPPALETVTRYASFSCPSTFPSCPAPLMLDRPSSVVTYSKGIRVSESDYSYDQGLLNCISPAPYGHDENNYGCGSTAPRGNPTSITRQCFSSAGNCTNSMVSYIYDTTGQVVSMTDSCGNGTCSDMATGSHKTQYFYTDIYSSDDGSPAQSTNAYVTTIIDPLSHSTTYKYGFQDGKLRTKTDVGNNQTTTYCYTVGGCGGSSFDSFFRLTGVKFPDNGKQIIGYSDDGPNPSVSTQTQETGSISINRQTNYDEYGHALQSALTSDPGGAVSTETSYDGLGRPFKTWNPTRCNPPTSNCGEPTWGYTTFQYDALNRKTQQIAQDGSSTQWWCFDGVASSANQPNCNSRLAGAGEWVDSRDENGNDWQRISDALGRLTNIVEPNGSSTVPTMVTTYTYDGLSNLLGVNQAGVSGNVARTRSFNYDSLSRLWSSSNVENGQVYYNYDLNGNLSSKTDARSVQTTYSYDVVNRVVEKTYSDGATPTACYLYDSASNGVGRLSSEWTQSNSNTSCAHTPPSTGYWTLRSFSAYDQMGRLWSEQQCTPKGCWTANPCPTTGSPQSYSYDLAGNLTCYSSFIAPPGLTGPISISQAFDAGAHISSVTSNWTASFPANLYTLSSSPYGFGPVGPSKWTQGPSLTFTLGYTNRLWLNSIQAAGQVQ